MLWTVGYESWKKCKLFEGIEIPINKRVESYWTIWKYQYAWRVRTVQYLNRLQPREREDPEDQWGGGIEQ